MNFGLIFSFVLLVVILYYCGSCPIDIIVYADNVADAITKAEDVTREYLSTTNRKIVIEEIPEWE